MNVLEGAVGVLGEHLGDAMVAESGLGFLASLAQAEENTVLATRALT